MQGPFFNNFLNPSPLLSFFFFFIRDDPLPPFSPRDRHTFFRICFGLGTPTPKNDPLETKEEMLVTGSQQQACATTLYFDSLVLVFLFPPARDKLGSVA